MPRFEFNKLKIRRYVVMTMPVLIGMETYSRKVNSWHTYSCKEKSTEETLAEMSAVSEREKIILSNQTKTCKIKTVFNCFIYIIFMKLQ